MSDSQQTVSANGREIATGLPVSLHDFLKAQGMLPRSVVVELNGGWHERIGDLHGHRRAHCPKAIEDIWILVAYRSTRTGVGTRNSTEGHIA